MNKVSVRNRNKGTGRHPNWEYRFEGAKINGKRHQISKSGFATKKEALLEGQKQLSNYSENREPIIATNISFHDYFSMWLDNHIVSLSASSKRLYLQCSETYILPFLGIYKLSLVNSSLINELLLECQKKGLSAKYLDLIHSLLNMAFDDALVIYHYIAYNPCSMVKIPRSLHDIRHRKPLTTEQWETIMQLYPSGSDFHILLCLGFYAGLRISEATALTWDDIDFQKNTIAVNKQILYQRINGKYKWVFSKPKTKTSVRIIYMPEILSASLLKEKERQIRNEVDRATEYIIQVLNDGIIEESHKPSNNRLFFVTLFSNGKRINYSHFSVIARKIKEHIPEFDFHTLRHTHATMLLESGAPLKAIQSRLGHSSSAMAMQVYTHGTDKLDRQTALIYDEFLKK